MRGWGFTLVELLVALCLVVLIAGTAVSTFAGGFRVWERIQTRGGQDQQISIAFQQIRRDLVNSRPFGPIGFEGSYDSLSFPGLVFSEIAGGSEELGRVGYFSDSTRKALCRSIVSYRQVRRSGLRDSSDPVLTDVERVRFSYYSFNPSDGTYSWSSEWTSGPPPMAVKLEVAIEDPSSTQRKTQSLIVPIPVVPPSKAQ